MAHVLAIIFSLDANNLPVSEKYHLLMDLCFGYVQRLYGSFEEDPGFFKFATAVTTNNPEESNMPC